MKSRILIFALLVIGNGVFAQGFFKAVPKVSTSYAKLKLGTTATLDSTINAFRPIANIAAYAEPGNILMAGAGLSYQHLKWDVANAKWNCQWSVSGIMWAGGSVAPQTPVQAISYGIMFGAFNNLIMVGPALNGNKVIATVAIGISLNN